MKAVILAGGRGTRISEESQSRPKPMVEIGGKPILWHIMKIYAAAGINDFVILLGYRGYMIKEYFANYFLHMSDVTIDLATNSVEVHQSTVRAVEGDAARHRRRHDDRRSAPAARKRPHRRRATSASPTATASPTSTSQGDRRGTRATRSSLTVTAVQPPAATARLRSTIGDSRAASRRSRKGSDGWVNGGFFVGSSQILDYIDGDDTVFEREPLERISADRSADGVPAPRVLARHGHAARQDPPRGAVGRRRRAVEGLGRMSLTPCRFCGAPLTESFCDLGMSPLANSYLPADALDRAESFYPLHAYVCGECFLVQLAEFESPENIFGDYAYFSSFSSSWLEHARAYVDAGHRAVRSGRRQQGRRDREQRRLPPAVLRRTLACRCSASSRPPTSPRWRRTGASRPSSRSSAPRPPPRLARRGASSPTSSSATTCWRTSPTSTTSSRACGILLAPEGVITMEFPHLLQLMQHNQFDTIYHEHFSYFSFLTVSAVFAQHGLALFDVEELPTHGGSLRIYGCHAGPGRAPGHRSCRARCWPRSATPVSTGWRPTRTSPSRWPRPSAHSCTFLVQAKTRVTPSPRTARRPRATRC